MFVLNDIIWSYILLARSTKSKASGIVGADVPVAQLPLDNKQYWCEFFLSVECPFSSNQQQQSTERLEDISFYRQQDALKNIPATFHPNLIRNDRDLGFFEDCYPTKMKKNKMSSNMRSVPDLNIDSCDIRVFFVCLLDVCSLYRNWLISVAISRGRWGRGLWQHRQWRSSLSTFSLHWGSHHHETGKLPKLHSLAVIHRINF